jgi:RNA polymerase sigma factor (sigma-70 family)
MHNDPLSPGDDDDFQQSGSLNDSASEDSGPRPPNPQLARLAAFERLYRGEFGPVVSYFARRYDDPQLVADLTADTFVAAIRSFDEFEHQEITSRAWTIGIARKVWARYRQSDPRGDDPARRRSLQQLLDGTETKELMWWIELERSSRELIDRLERMSRLDREAVELVDLCELTPAEAAHELDISTGALRVRLVRSRARLRREGGERG